MAVTKVIWTICCVTSVKAVSDADRALLVVAALEGRLHRPGGPFPKGDQVWVVAPNWSPFGGVYCSDELEVLAVLRDDWDAWRQLALSRAERGVWHD